MKTLLPTTCLLALLIAAAPSTVLAQKDGTAQGITEVSWGPRTYVVYQDTVAFAEIGAFYMEHFQALYSGLQQGSHTMTGPPSGLIWWWDEANGHALMGAGIPVAEPSSPEPPYELVALDEGRALTMDYYGPYEGAAAAHATMGAYLQAHDYGPPTLVIEEYITDPQAQPDTTKWLTRIFYLLAEEGRE